jgi:hypothetical protein
LRFQSIFLAFGTFLMLMRFTLEFEFDESFDGRGLALPVEQDVHRSLPAADGTGTDLNGQVQDQTPWQEFAEDLAGTLEAASNQVVEN